MTNEEFMTEVESSCARSKRTLLRKQAEYAGDEDRLDQFIRAGVVQNINPCEALIGMATKHFTSICDMAESPSLYNLKKWREKTGVLRNYMILLEALLKDMGVK